MTDKKTARPLSREHMPTGFDVSLDSYMARAGYGGGRIDGERRIPVDLGPEQSMRGFEKTYRNIIDYIVRITHRIWEERDVDYIGDTYSADSQVFDDYGLQFGNKKIINDTHHTTGAFSDIRLIADEVIWAGNDEIGFHTSHRTIIRGTNDGDSKYGPATGRTVDVMVIANCVALDNEIFLEHVLYNNSSLVAQLGLDLNVLATSMAASPPAGWPRAPHIWDALRGATRPARPLSETQPVAGFDVDAFARKNLSQIWNDQSFASLANDYDSQFAFLGTTDRGFSGEEAYVDMVRSLRQCFPELRLQMDEVYWMGNDTDGYLTSERWSGSAVHSGAGYYGEPTGADVQVWGITQHRIIDGHITHEWMLFNELDLMMQIAKARR